MNKRQAKKQRRYKLDRCLQYLDAILSKQQSRFYNVVRDAMRDAMIYGTGSYALRCDPNEMMGASPVARYVGIMRNINYEP